MESDGLQKFASVFDLHYPNVSSTSPLEGMAIRGFGQLVSVIGCRIMKIFQSRLYACVDFGRLCISWDLTSGEMISHEPLEHGFIDQFCFFAVAEVNGKLWVSGGQADGLDRSDTFFLTSDFKWHRGPYLPFQSFFHTAVSIDDTRVLIVGGWVAADRYLIYDDKYQTFVTKYAYELGQGLVASKVTDFQELGKDVILVRDNAGLFYTYDWIEDIWSKLDISWLTPKIYGYGGTILQVRGR